MSASPAHQSRRSRIAHKPQRLAKTALVTAGAALAAGSLTLDRAPRLIVPAEEAVQVKGSPLPAPATVRASSLDRASFLLGMNPGPITANSPTTFIGVLQKLGLTTNLRLCLDAGDAASYSGSGQPWLDRSGNGYDFFRGATSSATTDDPTFTGSVGSRSAYWAFDGGDFFRYDTINETWMQNLHKDNAQFTFIHWVYLGSITANNGLFGTSENGVSNIGIEYRCVGTSGILRTVVHNGSVNSSGGDSTAALSAGQWYMLGYSVNEGAASGFYFINGSVDNISPAYTSPSAGNASFTAEIMSRGNVNSLATSGSRLAVVAAWEGTTLTGTQVGNIFLATRGWFGV